MAVTTNKQNRETLNNVYTLQNREHEKQNKEHRNKAMQVQGYPLHQSLKSFPTGAWIL